MNQVPCRETGMTPYEMMLSESQERMLMVLKPGREPEAEAIFRKWELDFAVIGEVTDTGRMELVWNGETVADIPLDPLADEAPLYERPYAIPKAPEPLTDIPESTDIAADLLKLMASPNLASRRWVWEQYDQSVGADTIQRPGGDAAVVRVHGSKKALAITTDCTPRYCYADPVEGGKQAVAEAYRNLCAVGARPLAITNCLNFGNPQRPEIMGQLVGCIEGIAEACRALDFPVVSGNVSLYNETKGDDGSSLAILPTPAIGGVGLLDDWEKSATIGFKLGGDPVWLIGIDTNVGSSAPFGFDADVGQSLWLKEVHGQSDGLPPKTDFAHERAVGETLRDLIAKGWVNAVHDVSDGGILVAIAEMCLAGNVGVDLYNADNFGDWSDPGKRHQEDQRVIRSFFSEKQGMYVVSSPFGSDEFSKFINSTDLPVVHLGQVGGNTISFTNWIDTEISLADLRAAHEGFFPKLMGADAALA
jgi:phosphoribosylformylglycinamidine synthase